MLHNICDRTTLPLKAVSKLKTGDGRNQLLRVRDPVRDLHYLVSRSGLPFLLGDNAWVDSVGVAEFCYRGVKNPKWKTMTLYFWLLRC
jgi:hypothetical protein